MSSQWAPRHRTLSFSPRAALSSGRDRISRLPVSGMSAPHHPGTLSPGFHTVESDLVLEGIHCLPESAPLISDELALGDQPAERLLDQLLPLVDVPKDVGTK